ncbi:MAG: flagellar basal body rod protein FlgB [Gammaproteobacteria bacterium]
MPSFADAFGIHPAAVALRTRRAEVLAANIATADTPGYQARDIDFRAALGAATAASLTTTRAGHLASAQAATGGELKYRQPLNASLDQNTVDVQAERAAFLDNALRYQASMTFLNGRITGLMSALRGE